VAADQSVMRRSERLLAYGGAICFIMLAAIAVLLWAREGTVVYLTRLISDLPNCL